jgi:3-hydroxybutyryl-CoA dehydrogenase
MKILVIGEQQNLEECQEKFGHKHEYVVAAEHRDAEKLVASHDIVFDFIIDEEPYQFEIYANKSVSVFVNASKISLRQLIHPFRTQLKGKYFGFNGLPTFINAPLLEVCILDPQDESSLRTVCQELNTGYSLVDDRVGLVTPRVICMIINEAFLTVQEKTATREDIDVAMKLGTNYPFGPFEWCKRIGIKHVYEVLEAMYEDTHDERYKVCPLLKKEYLS